MPTDRDTLEDRLRAVERALGEGDPPESVARVAELTARVEAVEADLDSVTERLLVVEAAVQALQGYVGHVQDANREIGRRATAALAAVGGRTEPRTGDRDVAPADRDGTVAANRQADGRQDRSTGDPPNPAADGQARTESYRTARVPDEP